MQEISCGAVLFTLDEARQPRYLLVETNSGHISFAKGHIDPGETEEETARREILEETGLHIGEFFEGFRETYTYISRKGNEKKVVYFLGAFEKQTPTFQESEIRNSWLIPYEQARETINREREREILRHAHEAVLRAAVKEKA